ncbi:MAG TPA: beta galactosidase jelly roll domain-containing protein, partial [Verrucomicrobiae bacterium]|nr:beta galactosidase jelly roll domain-containing protein [Verrucomicrobiae bacterium]
MKPVAVALCLCIPLAFAAARADQRMSFDANWLFIKGDPPGTARKLAYAVVKDWVAASGAEFSRDPAPAMPPGNPGDDVLYTKNGFDDSGWRPLNLPHDWGIEGPFEQTYPGNTGKLPWWGVGWYRKHFQLAAANAGRRICLDVDGAMSYAMVWLNGHFVGGWPYGYSSWRMDLTPYIRFGGENVIAIRVDNPPASSRWYPGGGIYRNVWLIRTAPIHAAHWGVYVTTPNVSNESATVKIKVNVENDSLIDCSVSVKNEIYELKARSTSQEAANGDDQMGSRMGPIDS